MAADNVAVLAGALLAVLAAWPVTTPAQVLVSNMSKENENHVEYPVAGSENELLGGGYLIPFTDYQFGKPFVGWVAQTFVTGPNPAGYRFKSAVVNVESGGVGGSFTAYIYTAQELSNREGYLPSERMAKLDPRSIQDGRVYLDARTVDGEYPVLDPNRRYFVLMQVILSRIIFRWTSSDGEDPGGAPGWSIDDTSFSAVYAWPDHHWKDRYQWYDPSLKIEIHGAAVAGGAPVLDGGVEDTGTTRSVAENAAPGTNVGAPVSATDPDGDTLTYRLDGEDADSFAIDPASGQIQTRAGVEYDYEIKSSYSVQVVVDDDNGNSSLAEVTIGLTDVAETLTARFEGVRSEHDGSPFALRLAFSEPVAVGEAAMREDVLQVTNGRASGARRLSRVVAESGEVASSAWEIMLEPSGGALTVTVPPTASCADGAAVCTVDNRPLSAAITATAAQGTMPPLTARFVGAPATHRGSSKVKLAIEFSAAVTTDAEAMRLHALTVTNGRVVQARPDEGRNDRWQVSVAPKSLQDITVSLAATESCDDPGAVCAPDGRKLSAGATKTIKGPASRPLTASFGGTAKHDGSKVFEVNLDFSWPVTTTRKAMRQQVLTVGNGEVLDAWQLGGRSSPLWRIQILPLSNRDVTITLPATTSCDAPGAVCTEDGRMLSVALSRTVKPNNPNAVDETAPVLRAAMVNGASLALKYDEGLEETSTPEASAFTVTVAGTKRALATDDGVAVSGRWVRLTLSSAVAHGEAVTLDYTPPTGTDANALEDTWGNEAPALSGRQVHNNSPAPEDTTAPTLAAATVDRTALVLTYDESLDQASTPEAGAYIVTVAGSARALATTDPVAVSGQTVTLRLLSDVESGETVTLDYTVPTGTDANPVQDIAGNDAAALSGRQVSNETVDNPALSVADAEGTEGTDSGITFTVSLAPAATAQVAVSYATADVTAVAGEDYTATSGTLTFEPGETEKSVRVPIIDDTEEDGGETFTLTLSNPGGGAAIEDGEAIGTIRNQEDETEQEPLTAQFLDLPANHGGEEFTFDLHFSEEPSNLSYKTLRGHAPENIESVFVVTGGELVRAERDGQGNQSWEITVAPNTGADEISVTLPATTDCAATGAICTENGRPLSAAVVATVPRTAPVRSSLSVADAEGAEGTDSGITFAVSLAPAATAQVTVGYATADVTAVAGEDYTATSGTLTFEPGETEKSVSVPIIDDTEEDGGETFTLTLSNPGGGAAIEDGEAIGTIRNQEDETEQEPLTAEFLDLPADGHGGSAFTLKLLFSEEFSLSYRTLRDPRLAVDGGTLTGVSRVTRGEDREWNIKVTPDGDADVTVTLAATTDCDAARAICNADKVALSEDVSATVPKTVALPPTVTARTIWSSTLTVGERDFFGFIGSGNDGSLSSGGWSENGRAYTVDEVNLALFRLSGDGENELRVEFRPFPENIHGLTLHVDGAAKVLVEALRTGNRFTWPVGELTWEEGDRVFLRLMRTVEVAAPGPGLSVADAEVREGPQATLSFPVTLKPASSSTVTVSYATSDGPSPNGATVGADYTDTSGMLAFAPGETEKTVSVAVLDDSHDEGLETLTLTLSNASGAGIANGSATGRIVNSDPMPQAWLARFGRIATDHAVRAISNRWLPETPTGNHLTIGGRSARELLARPGVGQQADRDESDEVDDLALPDSSSMPWSGHSAFGSAAGSAGPMGGAMHGLGSGSSTPAMDMNMGASDPDRAPMPGGPDRVGGETGSPLGGRAAIGAVLRGLGLPDPGAVGDLRQALMGASFFYSPQPLDVRDSSATPGWLGHWSVWGETASTHFRGADGPLTLDGEVGTATLGVDSRWGRWQAGTALAYSMGDGLYTHPTAAGGEVSSNLASLHPFARFEINERASVWGILGYGTGALTLMPEGADRGIETDLATTMAAFGGRGVFAVRSNRLGEFQFALASDARMTNTVSDAVENLVDAGGATSRVRVMLEGSGSVTLASGGMLQPTLEAGLRYDGGDAETGTGLEVGGGLAWATGRLAVQVNARMLLAHEDAAYEEWGFSSSILYRPAENGQGLTINLGSAWGAAQSGVQELWSRQDVRGLAPRAAQPTGQRFQAELGYGLAGRGNADTLWYPYLGAQAAAGNGKALTLGLKLSSGPQLQAHLEIRRRDNGREPPDYAVQLQGAFRW